MQLEISDLRGVSGGKCIRFIGDLDTTNSGKAMETVTALMQEGYIKLVADFGQLRYVNSMGLGILLHFSKSAKQKKGFFKIANVNENVYEIIEIIGANTLLEIYDTLEEALSSIPKK